MSTSTRARRVCSSKELAASVVWGDPLELISVEARLMGSAPVCFNGSKWMAVDEDGRGYVVYVEGPSSQAGTIRVALHVFDANNLSNPYTTYYISPGRRVSALAAPCIAISSGLSGTHFTVAFLGKALGARSFEFLYVAAGEVSRSRTGRIVQPFVRIYNVLEMQPAHNNLSNPSVFMDDDGEVHLVYTAQPLGDPSQASVVAYLRATWNRDPNFWRWIRRDLGGVDYDASNASVAARWTDGQLVVVVACKIVQTIVVNGVLHAFSAVYCNVAIGSSRNPLMFWRGWSFLSGVDVLGGVAGNAGSRNAADPSVWVHGDGAFCVGYHELASENSTQPSSRPHVATNQTPEDTARHWILHSIDATGSFAHFVCVSGVDESGFCVWESRAGGFPGPARWEAATAALRQGGASEWIGLDPTRQWNLDLEEQGRDRLLFPTSSIVGDRLYVAWLYVDRTQDNKSPGNPMDSPLTWDAAPAGARISVQMLSGEITCL